MIGKHDHWYAKVFCDKCKNTTFVSWEDTNTELIDKGWVIIKAGEDIHLCPICSKKLIDELLGEEA